MKASHLFLVLMIPACFCFAQKVDFNDHKSCKPCHSDIYSEWETTRHNLSWTSEDFKRQCKDYTKQECLNCHAPQPLLETGMNKEPVLRGDDRKSGINCLTCHKNHNSVAAVYKDSKGECNPVFTSELKDHKQCSVCHLNTSEEWKKSSYSKPGKNAANCVECHMKAVKRPAAKGGKVREVHQHITYGGYDKKALEYAVLHLDAKVENGKVMVTLKNDNVGHNLPSGTAGRTLALITAVKDADDEVVWMKKEYFTKYDGKDRPDKSIPPDKVVSFTYDAKTDGGEVVVRALYKKTPEIEDKKAIMISEKKVSF